MSSRGALQGDVVICVDLPRTHWIATSLTFPADAGNDRSSQ